MARNALGQFTRRRRTTSAGRRRLGFPGNPVEGTEESGVVTGETITLGGEATAPARETAKAAKS
jgi:hypothetical protein